MFSYRYHDVHLIAHTVGKIHSSIQALGASEYINTPFNVILPEFECNCSLNEL